MKVFRLGLMSTAMLVASVATAQVMETSKGTLEFIGLSRWTPDSIYKKLGYTSLDQMHACAADLKMKLGFAEASVIMYPGSDPKKMYTVVSVVEPEDKALVSRTDPFKSVPLPDAWWPLIKAAASERRFEEGIQGYAWRNATRPPGAFPIPEQPWWKIAMALTSDGDLSTAVKAVKEDRDPSDRMLGATVLANFAHKPEAWHALVAGVRDKEDVVMGSCYGVLSGLSRSNPPQIDWTPAVSDLRAVLNGTSLFALNHVIFALNATKVSPTLAKDLVGSGGGRMLVAYVQAKHEQERTAALALLRQLSGKDLGEDAAAWKAWMASL